MNDNLDRKIDLRSKISSLFKENKKNTFLFNNNFFCFYINISKHKQ